VSGVSAASWREAAVARSLDPARARAETRVQRFLDAALSLMNESSGDRRDFTVQEVVERSGQSLRSFYQYFGGKHELLLALFEELVRKSAAQLSEIVETESRTPIDRLHTVVVEYHRMCRPGRGAGGRGRSEKAPVPAVMMEFAQQLLTSHPAEAARAYAPMTSLFRSLLADAASSDAIRADVDLDRLTGIVLQAIMFNAFASTISGTPSGGADDVDPGEELWSLLLRGIAAGPQLRRARP
jgi:AcrR family transcriptional regulator